MNRTLVDKAIDALWTNEEVNNELRAKAGIPAGTTFDDDEAKTAAYQQATIDLLAEMIAVLHIGNGNN